jgi:hypothetical protein
VPPVLALLDRLKSHSSSGVRSLRQNQFFPSSCFLNIPPSKGKAESGNV